MTAQRVGGIVDMSSRDRPIVEQEKLSSVEGVQIFVLFTCWSVATRREKGMFTKYSPSGQEFSLQGHRYTRCLAT